MSRKLSRLQESYEDFERIEEEFGRALDESLHPRGPDSLYDVVASLRLPRGARVLDLGCGKGQFSIALAERFGFSALGVDPVAAALKMANEALSEAEKARPHIRELVSFRPGSAEALDLPNASVDLIWCREVMVLVEALHRAFAECRRVLRAEGRMLLYQMFATEAMEPHELEAMCSRSDTVPENWYPVHVEAVAAAAGFAVEQRIDFGSEWGEHAEEQRGLGARNLVHAARLLREPQRYIARFGERAYEIKLGDCLWHVYRLIGKLSGRAYVLRPA